MDRKEGGLAPEISIKLWTGSRGGGAVSSGGLKSRAGVPAGVKGAAGTVWGGPLITL